MLKNNIGIFDLFCYLLEINIIFICMYYVKRRVYSFKCRILLFRNKIFLSYRFIFLRKKM